MTRSASSVDGRASLDTQLSRLQSTNAKWTYVTLFQINMELERAPYKTTIIHTRPAMSFHANLGEGLLIPKWAKLYGNPQ